MWLKYYRVTKQQTFISYNSGDWKVQAHDTSISGVWRGPPSWLIDGYILIMSLHGFFLVHVCREELWSLSSSTYKDTNPFVGAPPS